MSFPALVTLHPTQDRGSGYRPPRKSLATSKPIRHGSLRGRFGHSRMRHNCPGRNEMPCGRDCIRDVRAASHKRVCNPWSVGQRYGTLSMGWRHWHSGKCGKRSSVLGLRSSIAVDRCNRGHRDYRFSRGHFLICVRGHDCFPQALYISLYMSKCILKRRNGSVKSFSSYTLAKDFHSHFSLSEFQTTFQILPQYRWRTSFPHYYAVVFTRCDSLAAFSRE